MNRSAGTGPSNVYVAVGANIDPELNIVQGLEMLRHRVDVLETSPFYRNPPLDRPEQPDYYNGVWRIGSPVDPWVLKTEVLRPIEAALGRCRGRDPHGARPIDLDVILYGQEVWSTPELILPCPNIRRRAFVAVPLYRMAGDIRLPPDGMSLKTVVDAVSDTVDAPQLVLLDAFTRQLQERIERWINEKWRN